MGKAESSSISEICFKNLPALINSLVSLANSSHGNQVIKSRTAVWLHLIKKFDVRLDYSVRYNIREIERDRVEDYLMPGRQRDRGMLRERERESWRNAKAMRDVLSEIQEGGGVNLMPSIILPCDEGVMLFRRHKSNLAHAYGRVGVHVLSASRFQSFLMEQSRTADWRRRASPWATFFSQSVREEMNGERGRERERWREGLKWETINKSKQRKRTRIERTFWMLYNPYKACHWVCIWMWACLKGHQCLRASYICKFLCKKKYVIGMHLCTCTVNSRSIGTQLKISMNLLL